MVEGAYSWLPITDEIHPLPFVIARRQHCQELLSSFKAPTSPPPNYQIEGEVLQWFFPDIHPYLFKGDMTLMGTLYHFSPRMLVHQLEQYLNFHSTTSFRIEWQATHLIQAIWEHVHHSRNDPRVASFSILILINQEIAYCLRYITE